MKSELKPKIKPPRFGSHGADGFVFAARHEPHVQRYLVLIILYSFLAVAFSLPVWLISTGLIYFFFLIILELINTSIEILCDFVAEGHSIEIKRIKDLSAAALFVHGSLIGAILFSYCVYYAFLG